MTTGGVNRIETGVNFRQRYQQRQKDHERFQQLQATLAREKAFKAIDECDAKVDAIERQQELERLAAAGVKIKPQVEEKKAPARGIVQKEAEIKAKTWKDPRLEELYRLSLYQPHVAEEAFRHDYGDASRKLIAFNALQREHRSGEPIISNYRYLTNYPCGAQQTWNLMEPIYLRPTVECQKAQPYQIIEHQPLMKTMAFSEMERENELALRNLFTSKKGLKGLKDMTAAFAKSYSFTRQALNQKRILAAIEEQRCYDGRRGYTFKDKASDHFEWLEENAAFREINEKWLQRPRKTWTDLQQKTWEILVLLHRDYFKNEKKNLRTFFLQRAKKTDEEHYHEPYAPEMGYVLDSDRMLANLELWGVVNCKGKPTLEKKEMYEFLQLLGEHYSGAVSYEGMKRIMEVVRIMYPKHERAIARQANAQRMMQKERGRALEGRAASKFAKAHWGKARDPFVVQAQAGMMGAGGDNAADGAGAGAGH
ncbi:unnamed protein product [Amoebophrya sp. A120]|nr:unnamed protein product [Amoebophrya sp. A120]|eukprot:GSA120T00018840001.1